MSQQFVLVRTGDQWSLVPLDGTRPRFDVNTDMIRNASLVLDGKGSCTDALNALLTLATSSGYNHVQAAPATTWVVHHGLNIPGGPVVQVRNAGGQVVLVDITHTSPNDTTIGPFFAATAGTARFV